MNHTVRDATSADIPRLLELCFKLDQEDGVPEEFLATAGDFQREMFKEKNAFAKVAEVNIERKVSPRS